MSVCATAEISAFKFSSKLLTTTVIKTFFYLINRLKVKFKLMSLPDDEIVINHVTTIFAHPIKKKNVLIVDFQR